MDPEQTKNAVQAGLKFEPYPKQLPKPRGSPMQVLCLGLSRTGTMSTYLALNKLGIKSYHMVECSLQNANGSVKWWREAVDAKYFNGKGRVPVSAADFDVMLWQYQAVTDIPTVLFANELLAAYPDAKVILTERDADSWVSSIVHIFYPILDHPVAYLLQVIDWKNSRDYYPLLRSALRVWTHDDWKNRDKLRQGYLDHNDHIRKVVPAERLLIFHPRQGWQPLCEFLQRPVPDAEFPRVNEGSFAKDLHLYMLFKLRLMVVALGSLKKAGPLVVLGIAIWAYRRYAVSA